MKRLSEKELVELCKKAENDQTTEALDEYTEALDEYAYYLLTHDFILKGYEYNFMWNNYIKDSIMHRAVSEDIRTINGKEYLVSAVYGGESWEYGDGIDIIVTDFEEIDKHDYKEIGKKDVK